MSKVFISSTSEDLKECREAVRDVAIRAGFEVVMMEYVNAQGALKPCKSCMEKVDQCDVVVAIVAHRYGWIPPDQPGPKQKRTKSITWLECERAKKSNIEVLAFVIEEKSRWPAELRESYRLELGTPAEDVTRNLSKLKEFKAWLNSEGSRGTFTDCKDLATGVLGALNDWKESHRGDNRKVATTPRPKTDPTKYLSWLREQTSWIDIRGLQVGIGRAHRFPIEELYIRLTTITTPTSPGSKRIALEEALRQHRLVIVGDPGSGKTTFLRRVALELCRKAMHEPSTHMLKVPVEVFPLWLRISDLEQHIEKCRGREGAPTSKDSPAWLVHFFEYVCQEHKWELDREFFESQLCGENKAVLLLDGLDEAPSRIRREEMARLFENATAAYKQCRFVVTTRPGSYSGKATLADFSQVRVEDLEDEGVEAFLGHWSHSLFPSDWPGAEKHHRELQSAMRARPEIRRMARNPMMLTALAVVHWNERRLPEQRADLYESILIWLVRQREQRPGREPADECLELLAKLALGMQNDPRGRLTEVEKGRAAEIIAPFFREIPKEERLSRARQFLDEEEVDSGIVVSRGAILAFWHLTFQEYLAARSLAGLPESEQLKLLFKGEKLYRPEWREVLLLLAGTLHVKQGRSKVDALFSAVLDRLGEHASLNERARCAGLLGAMTSDLRPLNYQAPDDRFKKVLDGVLEVFDAELSDKIDLRIRVEAAEALGQAGDPRLQEDNWVMIPPSTLIIRAHDLDVRGVEYTEANDDQGPTREVQLHAFQIGRYPVTVQEFERFVKDDGYQERRFWDQGGFGKWQEPGSWNEQLLYPNRPVVDVSWYEAAAYGAWAGGRLPTEAEWERAAHGTEARKYPWGNEPPDPSRANYRDTRINAPTPVGLFPRGATPEGICDMAGNVWEWTADWYMPDFTPAVRGGSSSTVRGLDAALFATNPPWDRNFVTGFRCARDPVGAPD